MISELAKEPRSNAREEHREGSLARSIEQQTVKLPSNIWLWAAFGSIATSLVFQLTGDERKAKLCRPLGADVPASWPLQQAREAARFRRSIDLRGMR